MDSIAFDDLVRKHYAMIVSFSASLLGNRTEGEDLAQEVFVAAYRKLDQFDASRAPGPWLCGIARGLARNLARKRRPLLYLGDSGIRWLEALYARTDARPGGAWQAQQAALEECLAGMKEADRHLIDLKYQEGRSYEEISSRLQITVANVGKRLYRVRRKLADCVLRRLGVENAAT